MAVFTVGKNRKAQRDADDYILKYPMEQDLYNLMHYCCDKCVTIEWRNIYPYGVDCMVNQMLYLQRFRGKPMSTRAIHYIMSFTKDELFDKCKCEEVIKLLHWIIDYRDFKEYQRVLCLHADKIGRYDVHLILNPVNIYTYNLYHCSAGQFNEMMKELAAVFYLDKHIAINGISYIREGGRMVYGSSLDLYQDQKCWIDG